MRLEHVAIWTKDIERLQAFYIRAFGASAGLRYASATRPGFVSCFLSLPGGGSRLELMSLPRLESGAPAPAEGYAHLAISVGSPEAVVALTERLRDEGAPIVSPPRWTGDGYFESVISDPDGNLVEITA